jgi:hypothetical protein
MKKIYLLIVTGVLFVSASFAQVVTVTNPANTTPSLNATYPSLNNALIDLANITAISGPVIITLNPGNNQTAPVNGYTISVNAATTAVNNVTIEGSNNTITASASLATGALNNAIFSIIGADHITLQNFTMQENPANTVNTPAASNNMVEWGVALLHLSATNGAQNNTIQNNTISLNRNYRNSFGIYSSTRHTSADVGTTHDVTNGTTGPNSGNKFYGNRISNVNMGIALIGTGTAAFQDVGNDIGGSSAATGNTITDWGGAASLTMYISNPTTVSYGIYINHQTADNVSYNTLTSATAGAGTAVTFDGIRKDYTTTPAGTFTSTISHNTITMTSAFTGSNFECIRSQGMSTLATATINITDNNLLDNAITAAGTTSAFGGIINTSSPGTLNITNNIMRGLTTVSSGGFTGISNSGNVQNTININNNKIGDAVAGAATYSIASASQLNAITNSGGAATATVNITGNSMNGFSIVTSGQVAFIQNSSNSAVAVNIDNNQLGSTTGTLITMSGVQSSNLFFLYNRGATATTAVSFTGNNIRGITHVVTGTSQHQYITSGSNTAPFTLTVANNTFTNITDNTSGNALFIVDNPSKVPGAGTIINNNSIVTGYSKTAGGSVTFISCSGGSVNGTTTSMTNNNFSNISVNGSTDLYGISANDGFSSADGPTQTITGNTINNISAGSGTVYAIYSDYSAGATIANNTISSINSNYIIYGIDMENNNGQGTFNVYSNTIRDLNSTVVSGHVRGIVANSGSVPIFNIYSNMIYNLSSAGSSNLVNGVMLSDGQAANIYNNTINNLTNAGTSAPLAAGINIIAGTTLNIYLNKIHSIAATGNFTATSTIAEGIRITAGTVANVYNNFVSDLTAPNVSYTDVVRGIDISSTIAASNYNLYYNSVYVNASSTGTDFGSSGIYHTINATATTAVLNMIDNIIVNTSTPNGTGVTAAYRRSGTALNNYAATSNYNLLYAGAPSANRLLFYDGINSDQTLAAYQTRVSTRDANSISLLPGFASINDLHITTPDCSFNNKGIPVAGITADIDAATRSLTTPDIGADEVAGYAAVSNVALAINSTNGMDLLRTCDDGGWTYYTDPTDGSRFLFAIEWSSFDAAAKAAATVRITVDPAIATVNDNSVPFGTWTMNRYWNVDLHGTAMTGMANVRFFYDVAEKNATDAAAAAFLSAYPSGSPEPPSWFKTKTTSFAGDAAHMNADRVYDAMGLVDANSGGAKINNVLYAQFNSISSFSGGTYAAGVGPNTPLPIVLNYLRGVKQGSKNNLSWQVTCTSTPKATLTLERSSDATSFTAIYTIVADAVRCYQPFDYQDANPAGGRNFYRLKMTDESGKFTYSNIIVLLNDTKGFEVLSIAPNPVTTGRFKLNVTSAENTTMNVVIMDMQGRVIQQQTVSMIAGYNSLDMNVINLAAGTYTIYGTTASDRSKVIRFVRQ